MEKYYKTWSAIHCVLLIYGWINIQKPRSKSVKKRKINSVSKSNGTTSRIQTKQYQGVRDKIGDREDQ